MLRILALISLPLGAFSLLFAAAFHPQFVASMQSSVAQTPQSPAVAVIDVFLPEDGCLEIVSDSYSHGYETARLFVHCLDESGVHTAFSTYWHRKNSRISSLRFEYHFADQDKMTITERDPSSGSGSQQEKL